MKDKFIHIILLILINYSGSAGNRFQTPYSSWKLGVFGGGSYYLGEINQNHFSPINFAFGSFLRYNFDQRLNFKFGVNFGTISGDDKNSNSSFNNDRNFAFNSNLIEISSTMELNFFPFSALDYKAHFVSPYGYLGFAYAHHNPQASYNGIDISTADLETEGNSYSKHLLTIPMGVGVKFRFNRLGLGLDWGIRKTFTDYLDDVSTFYQPTNSSGNSSQQNISNTSKYEDVGNLKRGDQYSNDWYVFTGISLFVNLTPKDVCRSFN